MLKDHRPFATLPVVPKLTRAHGAAMLASTHEGDEMYCPQCGSEAAANWKFCKRCGGALNREAALAVDPVVTRSAAKKLTVGGQQYELGGFGRRLGGYLIDLLIVWVGQLILFAIVFATGPSGAGALGAYFAPFFYLWVSNSVGRSIGKVITGLRIIDRRGEAPGAAAGLGRTLAAILSGIPLMLGYLWAAWDDATQTWHDKLAGTYVVRG